MKNKKGLSTVVASVLIVMMSVATVAILWSAVLPTIRDNMEGLSSEKAELTIMTDQGYTVWHPDSNVTAVHLGRGPDEAQISELRFRVFYSGGNSEETVINVSSDILGPNTLKIYGLQRVDASYGTPSKVAVYVIYSNGAVSNVIFEVSNFPEAVNGGQNSTELADAGVIVGVGGGSKWPDCECDGYSNVQNAPCYPVGGCG